MKWCFHILVFNLWTGLSLAQRSYPETYQLADVNLPNPDSMEKMHPSKKKIPPK